MKRLTLLLIFCFICTIAFSQSNFHQKTELFGNGKLLFSPYKNIFAINELKGFGDMTLKGNSLFAPSFLRNKANPNRLSIKNETTTTDGMPCINPQGYFPMRIVSPSSAIKYSILIKEL